MLPFLGLSLFAGGWLVADAHRVRRAPKAAGPTRPAPARTAETTRTPEPAAPARAPLSAALYVQSQPNDGGRAIVGRFAEEPGPAREAAILAEVRAGHFAPIRWVAITNTAGKNRVRFYTSADVLKLGNERDAVRVSATHATAQRIADLLGTTLPTPLIVDLIHEHAAVKVAPCLRPVSALTSVMLEQDACVSKRLAEASPTWTGADGPASTLGKDWVLTNRLLEKPGRSANYGWFDKAAPNGILWQPVGIVHNDAHVDHSQYLRLIRRDVEVNDRPMAIDDVLTHAEYAWLLSKEGPLKVLRLPSVPKPDEGAPERQAPQTHALLESVRGIANTSAAFRAKVADVAGRLGMDPNHLMMIMSFETRGTFSPSERNPYSGATGLIQFLPSTAKQLGTTIKDLSAMSAVDQLDWVERYLRSHAGRLKSLQDAYMAVLWPPAIGKTPDFVLWHKGSREYTQNAALDASAKGYVTADDATRRVLATRTPPAGGTSSGPSAATVAPATTTAPAATAAPAALPLGERAVKRSLAEMERGAGENPRGSNAGPDVRTYFAGAVRDGKPLKLEQGDWCAAAACWAAFVERSPGERIPHEWRVSGQEIQQDAAAAGAWRPVESVRSGAWSPSRGDLALWQRGAPGSWERHVARVVEADSKAFRTIGANEDHGWRLTPRDLADPKLLGFVDYSARPEVAAPRAGLQGARVLLVGDSIAVGLSAPLKRLVTDDGATLATRAHVGTTIREWARNDWLESSLATAKPGIVAVSLGTNDMEIPTDRTKEILAIADRIRAAGARLVWVEPPPMPTLQDRGRVRAALHATIPPQSLFPSPTVPIQRAKDQIHATPQGYADLAAALWSWSKLREV